MFSNRTRAWLLGPTGIRNRPLGASTLWSCLTTLGPCHLSAWQALTERRQEALAELRLVAQGSTTQTLGDMRSTASSIVTLRWPDSRELICRFAQIAWFLRIVSGFPNLTPFLRIAFWGAKNCESQVWGDSREPLARDANRGFSANRFARTDSRESPRFALRIAGPSNLWPTQGNRREAKETWREKDFEHVRAFSEWVMRHYHMSKGPRHTKNRMRSDFFLLCSRVVNLLRVVLHYWECSESLLCSDSLYFE